MLTFKRLTGAALHQYIDELARLRMQVFRAFPYLYDGNANYEAGYLKTYVNAPDSVVVLAFDNKNRVVGASTGVPLQHETEAVKQPFLDAGMAINHIFYYGESVLLPQFRGQGAGVTFFKHREAHASNIKGITSACFCAVVRPDDHPARPVHFQPLDQFWQHRGYQKCAHLTTTFHWKDIGEQGESAKPMTFWMKKLR